MHAARAAVFLLVRACDAWGREAVQPAPPPPPELSWWEGLWAELSAFMSSMGVDLSTRTGKFLALVVAGMTVVVGAHTSRT